MSDADKSVLVQISLNRSTPSSTAAASPVTQQRREDQETGRRVANKYAEEALLEVVSLMRGSKDENTKMKCAKLIMDRAWGQTKALTEEEKKGADAGSILDVLASVSVTQTTIENEQRGLAQRKPELIEGQSTVLVDDAEDLLAEVAALEERAEQLRRG